MKSYRVEMLSSLFLRSLKRIFLRHVEIIDRYNFIYETDISPSQIILTKVLTSPSARAIKYHYVISKNEDPDKNKEKLLFVERNKYTIIKKLKKYIKLGKFPTISFVYDNKYEEAINAKITEKLNELNE